MAPLAAPPYSQSGAADYTRVFVLTGAVAAPGAAMPGLLKNLPLTLKKY